MPVIREAREAELDEVARVLALTFEQHRRSNGAAGDPLYQQAFDRYFDDILNVRGRSSVAHVFVAVEGQHILGTGTLYPPGAAAHYARAIHTKPWPDEWASLRLLAVHPAHRRRGIGQMLLDARVERSRELGAKFVALHTAEEFASGRRLVRRLGWQRCPEFDHTPAPGICAEAYVLALDGSSLP